MTHRSAFTSVVLTTSLLLGVASGCDDGDEKVSHGMRISRIGGGPAEIGVPLLVAVAGARSVSDCPLVGTIDQKCPTTDVRWMDMEIASSSCTIGQCDVRRVDLAVSSNDATRAFFAGPSAPPPEHAVLFEVTPRTADATFEVRGRFDGAEVVRTLTLTALQADKLDLAEWTQPSQDLVPVGEPLAVLAGATLNLRCPAIGTRYDGADSTMRGVSLTARPDELEAEVKGGAITIRTDASSCDRWLTIEASSVGRSEIVVKRRDLTTALAIRVADPSEVRAFTVHDFAFGAQRMTAQPLIELRPRPQDLIRLGCALQLEDGARAFGGCGTLKANAAANLERPADEPEPLGPALTATFVSTAPPTEGAELRGKVGAVEVVLPVR